MVKSKGTLLKKETQLIEESFSKPVLIVFTRSQSGSSELLMYVVDQIKNRFKEQIVIEEFPDNATNFIAKTFVGNSSPSLLILKDGGVVSDYVGLVSRKTLEKKLNELLSLEVRK